MAEKLQKQDYQDPDEEEKLIVQDCKLRDQALVKDILGLICETMPDVKMQQNYGFMKGFLTLLGAKISEIPEAKIVKLLDYFIKIVEIDDDVPEDSQHNTPHESPISEQKVKVRAV